MNFNIKSLPERKKKPRDEGLTMVIDKGSSIQQCKDLIESSSQFFDVIKFGWTTSNFMNYLKKKIQLFKDADIDVYFGGTLFEAFAIRNQFEDYISILKDYNLNLAEVSDGSISIPHKKNVNTLKNFQNTLPSFLRLDPRTRKK